MFDTPTRGNNDELICPRCNSLLNLGNSPLYIADEFVGSFESMVCSICNYFLFTSKGYDMGIKEAYKYGLIGPREEIIFENIIPVEHTITIPQTILSSNFSEQDRTYQSGSTVETKSTSRPEPSIISQTTKSKQLVNSKVTNIMVTP